MSESSETSEGERSDGAYKSKACLRGIKGSGKNTRSRRPARGADGDLRGSGVGRESEVKDECVKRESGGEGERRGLDKVVSRPSESSFSQIKEKPPLRHKVNLLCKSDLKDIKETEEENVVKKLPETLDECK